MRLADFDGLFRDQADLCMTISRQTFGTIIAVTHRKIADFLINGKALKIEDGYVSDNKTRQCTD